MTRQDARALFSDYLENTLNPAERDSLQAYLASEPEAAAELIGLERTLSLLHRLPEREPTLDLWREIVPEMEAFRSERRQSVVTRLRGQWSALLTQASTGVILWTGALARRTHHHFSRHLLHDPWQSISADKRND